MTSNKEKVIFITDKYLKENSTLEIPEGVKNFDFSFNKYTNIKKIIMPSTLATLTYSSYFPTSINEIEVNKNNKKFYVEDNMLIDNEEKALIACFSKDNIINVKDGIVSIKNAAFIFAINVQEIYLPESIIYIADAIINNNNTKLTKISIGSKTSYINPSFTVTTTLKFELDIDSNNPYYTSVDGVLYTKNKEKLVRVYKAATNDIQIDRNVKIIGDNAFYAQRYITEYKIPEGIETIGNSFAQCPKLKKIEIPSTVKSIAANCFTEATSNLEEIIVNKKENEIPNAPWGAVKGLKVVKWVGK